MGGCRWRLERPLALLVLGHLAIPLRCLRALGWHGHCYQRRVRPCDKVFGPARPVLYIFPMIGFSGSHAVVAIQVGYCVSDIISKCGVGLIIYCVTAAKSAAGKEGALLPQ